MSDYISHEDMMNIPATEVCDTSKLASNPVVSVIMMAYNHETYIAQAIEGVVRQQCNFPIELLIGEDCSTDRTRGICVEYQKRYPKLIRLITAETNVGMHKNTFRLLGRSKGRYVAICEGDDYWCDKRKLEKQVRMLDSHPGMNLCFSRVGVCQGHSEKVITEWYPRREKQCYALEDFISGRVTGVTCTVCFNREVVSTLPSFIEAGAMTDWPLLVLALVTGYAGYIPEMLAVYRMHPNGAWSSATPERRYDGFKTINRLLRMHLGTKYYGCFDTSLAKAYCIYAEKSCVEGGKYGLFAAMTALNQCPVSPWRAGRTLVAFLIHIGLPRIYAGLLAAKVIRRMQH